MAIALSRWTLHEEHLEGQETLILSAGDKVQVRKQEDGETTDVLPVQTVPAGKVWTATVVVRILETDA